MTGKNHGRAGLIMAISIPIIYNIEPDMAIITGGACFIGSLFPDIDSPSSNISKYIPIIPTIINKVFGHRNLLHSPFFLILLNAFGFLGLRNSMSNDSLCSLLFGFSIGFLLHVLLDMFTVQGSPLFYPLWKKKVHFTKRKSGEWGESIIMYAICCTIVGGIFYFQYA